MRTEESKRATLPPQYVCCSGVVTAKTAECACFLTVHPLLVTASSLHAAEVKRIPPPGVRDSTMRIVRSCSRASMRWARRSSRCAKELAAKPQLLALLPDVRDLPQSRRLGAALRRVHGCEGGAESEGAARRGMDRAKALHAGESAVECADGARACAATISKIDGSVQPYGVAHSR